MKFIATNLFALGLGAAFAFGSSAASSAPVNLQYDEIVRVVVGQATPPPPGSFRTDLAAINSATSDQAVQAPPKKHGFGNMLGAVLSGQSPLDAAAGNVADNAMSNAMSNAMGGMLGSLNAFTAFMRQGKVARYTFYNGWERMDDAATQTATINKYDQHQIIVLNLQKKTYRTTDTSPQPSTATTTAAPSRSSERSRSAPQQPGTAVVDFSREGAALGAQVLDGVPTTGYSNKITMAMTQATGSCRNGSFSVSSSQYFSKFAEPQIAMAASTMRPSTRVPTDPQTAVSRGGCTPTFTMHNSGPTPPSGRFMMYSSMSMQPQQPSSANASSASTPSANASNIVFVTERGNVQTLSASNAAALFEIPAGFTAEP